MVGFPVKAQRRKDSIHEIASTESKVHSLTDPKVNNLLATMLTPPLLPIALAQGYWTRTHTPRLPDAEGPASGAAPGDGPRLKLITLGESTVAGMGARAHEFALTGQTALALAQHTRRSVSWLAIGRSGITAREALTELVPRLTGQTADVVVIALGVNDSVGFTTASRWATDIERVVQAVRELVGDQLVVLAGVPPLRVFPALPQPLSFVLGTRASVLDKAAAALARNLARVVYVPFRLENKGELFCQDGFHPSELGYKLWGEQLGRITAAQLS
jgi:lysophospholipase L1-like esterase